MMCVQGRHEHCDVTLLCFNDMTVKDPWPDLEPCLVRVNSNSLKDLLHAEEVSRSQPCQGLEAGWKQTSLSSVFADLFVFLFCFFVFKSGLAK